MILSLESQVSSLESSKRLKELGCPQEVLFYWCQAPKNGKLIEALEYGIPLGRRKICSSYTVAEIIAMLPEECEYGKAPAQAWEIQFLGDEYAWCCNYRRHQLFGSTLVKALEKMLIYLIENNLMEVPK